MAHKNRKPMLLDGNDLMERINRRLELVRKLHRGSTARMDESREYAAEFHQTEGRLKELAGFFAHFVRASRANFKYEERKKKEIQP